MLAPNGASAEYFASSPEFVAKAMRARKAPYFAGIGSFSEDSARNPLRLVLSRLVTCELTSEYAQGQCEWAKIDLKNIPSAEKGEISLEHFGVTKENSRIILRAFSGFLRGASPEVSGDLSRELQDFLAVTAALLAKDQISAPDLNRWLQALKSKKLLTRDLREGSLQVFGKFVQQVEVWVQKNRVADAISPITEIGVAFGNYEVNLCGLKNGDLRCWGQVAAELPEKDSARAIAGMHSWLCGAYADRVQCWRPGYPYEKKTWPVRGAEKVYTNDNEVCFIAESTVRCESFYEKEARLSPNISFRQPVALAMGIEHACAVDLDGVKCWGRLRGPDFPAGLKNIRAISSSKYRTCVLTESGPDPVVCAGDPSKDELPKNLKNPFALALGKTHSCLIDDEGIKCWGSNERGESSPPPLKAVRQIWAGDENACAVDVDGLHCWGRSFGEAIPAAARRATAFAASETASCAIDQNRVLHCWSTVHRLSPPTVPSNLKNPREISAGQKHFCAIDEEGVKCWGGEDRYGVNNPPTDLKNPRKLVSGNYSSCVLDDEDMKCWGGGIETRLFSDLSGILAIAASDQVFCAMNDREYRCKGHYRYAPEDLGGLENPESLATGFSQTCALDQGQVKCTPKRDHGLPNVPANLKRVLRLAAAVNRTCAIDIEGVKCWANNGNSYYVPGHLRHPTELFLSNHASCVLDGGELQCWGQRIYGF